jgi:protein O-GlcNAc transferase
MTTLRLTFVSHDDPQAVVRANRSWGRRRTAGGDSRRSFPRPDRRLRVGYVSPEFAGHAFLAHFQPLLANHDRDRFELHGYAQSPRSDAWTQKLREQFDHWHEIGHLPLGDQATVVRSDRIDVLVNLTGYLAHHRQLFAHRAAPVQLAYGNHVSTTGLATVDARLTDPWLEPQGAPFIDAEERLLRLETGHLSYSAPASPEVDALPALRSGVITFGVFNNIAKLSDAAIETWGEVLRQVPRSRILIKGYGLDSRRGQERLLAFFARQGIEPSRIDLIGHVTGQLDNFATLAKADLALDPFPFTGGMSTVETLWMGIPVVSLAGPSLVHRIGLSYLARAGFADWVVDSRHRYVDLAVALAGDLRRLAETRRTMRDRLRRSVLFDVAAHAREVEAAYLALAAERARQAAR